jgi:hypothetical protein
LSVAEELIQHPALSDNTRILLQQQRGAFLLGNTAPDVQTISGQARLETHFFDLPLHRNDMLPWVKIFRAYPGLEGEHLHSQAQAAFVAGYLCHLQADWLWVKDIFAPAFGLHSTWQTFERRLYLHNVLRSYLDRELYTGLGNGVRSNMERIQPSSWLPFVQDMHLVEWRNFLTGQLQPGAEARTVEVFAVRQGIPQRAYYELLESEERMEAEVFSHIPRPMLVDYRSRLIDENLRILIAYTGSILR